MHEKHTKHSIFRLILSKRQKFIQLGILSIGLFGSYVRGEQTDHSDIDLLVEFAPGKHTFDNFMEASFILEELLNRHVELLTPESLSPYIGPHIMKEVERVSIAA